MALQAVGFLPGSLLFSLLGHHAGTLLAVLLDVDDADRGELWIVCVELALVLAAITALALRFRRVWRDRQRAAVTESALLGASVSARSVHATTAAANPLAAVPAEDTV